MDYLVSIVRPSPLVIHFSFHNANGDAMPAFVPRLIGPLGYFISLEITAENGAVVYETFKPKIKLKLHPDRQESYLALESGYTYGSVLTVEDFSPSPGAYRIALAYSNEGFRGFPGHALGEMRYRTEMAFEVR